VTITRIGYGCLAAASVGATIAALHPRLVAFNQTSQGHQIAMARAETCAVVGFVEANSIPLDSKTKRRLPAGTFTCDFYGNTSQINGRGASDWVRSGQPEQIAAKLKQRGFKPPQ
jgi:hypothetical protein